MKEKTEGLKFKKHLIHVLIAGAITVSLGALSHVHTYISHNWRPTANRKVKNKSGNGQLPKITGQTMVVAPPPPPKAPKAPKATAPTPTVAAAPAAAPAVTVAKAKSSPVSLVTAVAAKAGLNVKADANQGITITKSKVDTGFIRKVEGSVLKGYVPLAATTNSGVTIADGFDLGQMHLSEFNKLPISDALKTKLQPYIGLTRFRAKAFLQSHPLTINETELTQLNVIAANKILQPLVKAYNKASGTSFFDLPAAAQTAIFSYAYQHGPGFMRSSSGRKLWNEFTSQNWRQASATLRSFKMYAPRRAMEAKLLDQIS